MAGGMGVALLVVVVVTAMYQNSRHYVLRIVEGEGVYREASLGMREQVPDRSAVLCMQASGAVEYYTDLVVVRWDRLSAERFETLRRNIESKGFQWYALLFPCEEEGFRNRVPGRWETVGQFRQISFLRLMPDQIQTGGEGISASSGATGA